MAELVGFLAEKFGYWKKTCGSYTSAQNNLLKKKEYDKSGKTNLVSWTATPSSRISIFPIIPGK